MNKLGNIIPCFRCIFVEELKARVCNPTECNILDDLLFEKEKRMLKRKSCTHQIMVKSGVYRYGGQLIQRYKCTFCGKHGIFRKGYSHKMKHSNEVVEYARSRIGEISTRDVAKEINEKFGVLVSHVAVYDWTIGENSQKKLFS